MVVVEALASSVEAIQALSIQTDFRGSRTASQKAADKGADKDKAPMFPHFIVDYDPDMPSGEPKIAIGMCFKATDQELQNRRLIGELAKMVMLPADWEVKKVRPVSEIQSGAYMSLIGISI